MLYKVTIWGNSVTIDAPDAATAVREAIKDSDADTCLVDVEEVSDESAAVS